MSIKKSLFYFVNLVVFQFSISLCFGQEMDPLSLTSNHWVDSVFSSLTETEKVDQLLVLKGRLNDSDSTNYGGFILNPNGPTDLEKSLAFLDNNLSIPGLVYAYLDDKTYGIAIDSIDGFISPMELAAISEPHLLYETGRAISEQCNLLGVQGLISTEDDMLQNTLGQDSWRMSEINQGFLSHQVLPLDFIQMTDFEKLDLNIIKATDHPMMFMIDAKDVSEFHSMIQGALDINKILMADIDSICRQILAIKFWTGLGNIRPDELPVLSSKVNSSENNLLKHELTKASLTVLKNDNNLLPIQHLENVKIASLSIGKISNPVFENNLSNYTQVDHYHMSFYSADKEYADLWSKLKDYDLIIEGIYASDNLAGIESFMIFQEWVNQSGKGISTYFGNPKLLVENNAILNSLTLILAYADGYLNNSLIPQLIFGGIESNGILPLSINENLRIGQGIAIDKIECFSYTIPEAVGLQSETMEQIDTIVYRAISGKAMPGCQVLIAKDNKVVFKKSYGYQTYDSLLKINDDDMYDLASLTKVSGALPGLMKLYEEGKFDLDATLGTYLKYFRRSNKKELTFREILAHQSGIKPYIVYWKTAIKKNGKYRRKTISAKQSDNYPYELTDGLYLHKDYKKKIYKQIRKSELGEKKYKYSGLTFYLFPDIIEAITGEDFTDYIYNNFYRPLGATTLRYNPLNNFNLQRLVPTEYDSGFRKSLVHGHVHDEGAAMMEGVSSNAGLFASANDLAKLFQMYCNYGEFGGHQYLKKETVMEFSRCQYPDNDNRRGLGFDRPLTTPHENGNTAKSVSQLSFGHSGFTGTFAWADPANKLVYIFLSNRVYPTRENRKLYTENIRTNIQEVIYKAME